MVLSIDAAKSAAGVSAAVVLDYALAFDGDGYVETPITYDGSHPLTIEAWVTPSSEGQICRNLQRGSGVVSLGCHKDEYGKVLWIAFYSDDGGKIIWVRSKEEVQPARLYHVAAIFDASDLRLFVDGKQVSSRTLSESPKPSWCGLRIGGEEKGGTFHGFIRSFRVSSTSRYDKDFTPETRLQPDTKTLALYHFDEGQRRSARRFVGQRPPRQNHRRKWVKADGSPVAAAVDSESGFTAQLLYTLPGAGEFVMDGTMLQVGRKLYDPETGDFVRDLLPASETRQLTAGPALSGDGKRMAWITKDGELTVWVDEAGKPLWTEKFFGRGNTLVMDHAAAD